MNRSRVESESDVSSDTTAGVPQDELNDAFQIWRILGHGMTPLEQAEELAETAGQGTVPDPELVLYKPPSMRTTVGSTDS